MGSSLQKEADATQGGRKEPGRRACHPREIRHRAGGGQCLLRRECPSLARQRRCLKREDGEVGGRAAPAGRRLGAAPEPRGSPSLAGSPRTKQGSVPRVEVGAAHPELRGRVGLLHAGGWGRRYYLFSLLPSRPPTLQPHHALNLSHQPRDPKHARGSTGSGRSGPWGGASVRGGTAGINARTHTCTLSEVPPVNRLSDERSSLGVRLPGW